MQDRDFRNATGALVAHGKRANGAAESMAPSAEAQAGNGHDLLGSIVDTSREGMIVIDSRGSILLFNPACEQLFGYHRDEVLGRSATMLIRAPRRDQFELSFEDQGNSDAGIRGLGAEDAVGHRKDGSTFPASVSIGAGTRSGDPVVFGIIRDRTGAERTLAPLKALSRIAQTRRKRIEQEAAERLEAVGRLSGGIAHDFNNLLTAIIGNADLIAESLDDGQVQKLWAERIIHAAERAAYLTQRMLAFGRKQLLHPVEVDCNALIESMHELLHRTLPNDIHIATRLEPQLARAYADPAQLQSALLGIALNARDAMPAGGGLTITTGNATLDESSSPDAEIPYGAYVMIAMTDEGAGMQSSVRARAFEPFFTTKDVGKGSGLGLSMVHGFAKQSHGHVTLQSEPGLGTTVRVYLPASPVRPLEAATPLAENQAAPRGQGTVLVVEDDPFMRGYAVRCLQSLGYRAISAADGEEALAKLVDVERIDLLFGDIVLSGDMNGWDLAARAKQVRPAIKVLLTAGHTSDSLAKRGHLKADAEVLDKPYSKSELASRVRETLAG